MAQYRSDHIVKAVDDTQSLRVDNSSKAKNKKKVPKKKMQDHNYDLVFSKAAQCSKSLHGVNSLGKGANSTSIPGINDHLENTILSCQNILTKAGVISNFIRKCWSALREITCK